MVKHNLRTFAFLIIGVAFATWILLVWIHHGFQLGTMEYSDIKQMPTAISVNAFIWFVFVSYLWKWKVFSGWLIQVPDLSGEWEGVLKSNWRNAEGELLEPIPTTATITQSFFHINVKVRTGEMESNSSAASLDIDADRGYKRLWYSYISVPNADVRHRSEIHYGTTVLSIKNVDNSLLEGEYWTSRQSTGSIILRRA